MKKFSIILIVVLFSIVNAFGQTLNPTYQSVTYSELGSFPSIKDGRVFKYHDSLWFDNGSMFINLIKVSRGNSDSAVWADKADTANHINFDTLKIGNSKIYPYYSFEGFATDLTFAFDSTRTSGIIYGRDGGDGKLEALGGNKDINSVFTDGGILNLNTTANFIDHFHNKLNIRLALGKLKGLFLTKNSEHDTLFSVDTNGLMKVNSLSIGGSPAVDTTYNIEDITFSKLNADTGNFNKITSSGHQISLLNDTLISFSSTQINNGDTLILLPAPGSGKCYMIGQVYLIYKYNSAVFSGSGNSYVRYIAYNGTYTSQYYAFSDAYFASSSSFIAELVLNNAGNKPVIRENSPVWIDWDNTIADGDGSAKIEITYKIITL